jgi:hypothetical protein
VTNISILDDLAELGARTALAPRGLILKRDNATHEVSVVGRYGSLYEPTDSDQFPAFIYPDADFIAIPDVRADARLSGHPMLNYVPRITSLIVAKISPQLNYSPRYTFTLFISNSDPAAFVSPASLGAITHVVNVCRQFVSALGHDDAFMEESSRAPLPAFSPFESALFQNVHSTPLGGHEAANYLMDTLPRKHVLHEIENGSFVSLRTWKKSIKNKQIEAYGQTSENPPDDFLEGIASELAVSAQRIFGTSSIETVVALPKVAGRATSNLPDLISQRVARKLGLKFFDGFSQKARTGGGAKKSPVPAFEAALSYRPQSTGGVLLLDDLATSKNHIATAQGLIRDSGATCFAMSWLGPY